jgi:uncharacterized protein
MRVNPFTFDRPVAPEDLIDREDEVATLLHQLEDGTNTRLSSPRRYGKTSLLGRVLREVEGFGMGRVYVDLYGARTTGQVHTRIERAYESELKGPLARAFASAKRAGAGGGLSTPFGGAQVPVAPQADERQLLDLLDLPARLHRRTGIRIAVAFDEFQEVLDARGQVDALMRSVIQHHGDAASYVFAGSHPGLMGRLFGDRGRPFYGQASPLVLGPLDEEHLSDYIGDRFERSGRDPLPALRWLLELAQGHPQRAMLMAHLLWNEVPPGEAADEDRWDRVLTSVRAFVRDEFEGAWGALASVERGVVEAVTSAAGGLTSRQTLNRFNLTKGGAPPAAERLVAAGILIEDRDRPVGYRVVDPLFERWIGLGRRWD